MAPDDSLSFTNLKDVYCADSTYMNGTTLHNAFNSVVEPT